MSSENKIVVGICAMATKSGSHGMREILQRLALYHSQLKIVLFEEEEIIKNDVTDWPICDTFLSFYSTGFPLSKAIAYVKLRKPFVINDLEAQMDLLDRIKVHERLHQAGITLPRYGVCSRFLPHETETNSALVEDDDSLTIDGILFQKPFVEKPCSAEDHNVRIYFPSSAGRGSQQLFRKVDNLCSSYSSESKIRRKGSFIYEDFMPTDGSDVKVYTVGPHYAYAEARKAPGLDGKVERDSSGKEMRYAIQLTAEEKEFARKIVETFKQTICGFDILRSDGKSYICDVNGFSVAKNSPQFYEETARVLGHIILEKMVKSAITIDNNWAISNFDNPSNNKHNPGELMKLRTVVGIIRHGDRTPKQKMKMKVNHKKFFDLFRKYDGFRNGKLILKQPKQLQDILDIARDLLVQMSENENNEATTFATNIYEQQSQLEQLKLVLEMHGHFKGVNRKVQLKYLTYGQDLDCENENNFLLLILKWGGELTSAGKQQAELSGRAFHWVYASKESNNGAIDFQNKGFLRLHRTYLHDLEIYASEEDRVQISAAAFAKGLLSLDGELTPILVQIVKSANSKGLLLDDDDEARNKQKHVKNYLHSYFQQDKDIDESDLNALNPSQDNAISCALQAIENPRKTCNLIFNLMNNLLATIRLHKSSNNLVNQSMYMNESLELCEKRWAKLVKDFRQMSTTTEEVTYDISKVPDIYDSVKYDMQHNKKMINFENLGSLYVHAKNMANVVVPQEYGIRKQDKLAIGKGICTPLLKKLTTDLNPLQNQAEMLHYSRLSDNIRTRLYFTSKSHIHSVINCLRFGNFSPLEYAREQWMQAIEFLTSLRELNFMTQIVIMLYEDTTKSFGLSDRFQVEIHFSPGAAPRLPNLITCSQEQKKLQKIEQRQNNESTLDDDTKNKN